ncbi:MAG: hypothetical protein LBH00_01270 [Planctomycetaceae bacterium]|jgi:hypothetical protein|nr:hypothetical protein [Planctomycetaceae bacterium]
MLRQSTAIYITLFTETQGIAADFCSNFTAAVYYRLYQAKIAVAVLSCTFYTSCIVSCSAKNLTQPVNSLHFH